MKKIYTDTDITKMGYYKSVLESNGIPAHIKNDSLSSCMGAIPMGEVWPELWVINDEDLDSAIKILKEIEDKIKAEPSDSSNSDSATAPSE